MTHCNHITNCNLDNRSWGKCGAAKMLEWFSLGKKGKRWKEGEGEEEGSSKIGKAA